MSENQRGKRPKDMTLEELRALPRPWDPGCERRGRSASYWAGDDIMAAEIDDGVYTFGQFADGSWYREPA